MQLTVCKSLSVNCLFLFQIREIFYRNACFLYWIYTFSIGFRYFLQLMPDMCLSFESKSQQDRINWYQCAKLKKEIWQQRKRQVDTYNSFCHDQVHAHQVLVCLLRAASNKTIAIYSNLYCVTGYKTLRSKSTKQQSKVVGPNQKLIPIGFVN